MDDRSDELRLYFARVKPIYSELFGMAHAICGSYEQAEFALQRAVFEGWNRHRHYRSSRGFRESMRALTRRIAIAGAKDAGEVTWNGASAQSVGTEDEITALSMQESAETRRILALAFGCALSTREIALVTGDTRRHIDDALRSFVRKVRRRSPARAEQRIESAFEEQLAAGVSPDPGAVYRAFEVEASQTVRGGRYASKIAVFAAYVLALAMLAAIIWGVAAVIRPTKLDETAPRTETLQEQN